MHAQYPVGAQFYCVLYIHIHNPLILVHYDAFLVRQQMFTYL